MHHLPEIAIIEPNTLTALGLRTILEELIPEAENLFPRQSYVRFLLLKN